MARSFEMRSASCIATPIGKLASGASRRAVLAGLAAALANGPAAAISEPPAARAIRLFLVLMVRPPLVRLCIEQHFDRLFGDTPVFGD